MPLKLKWLVAGLLGGTGQSGGTGLIGTTGEILLISLKYSIGARDEFAHKRFRPWVQVLHACYVYVAQVRREWLNHAGQTGGTGTTGVTGSAGLTGYTGDAFLLAEPPP